MYVCMYAMPADISVTIRQVPIYSYIDSKLNYPCTTVTYNQITQVPKGRFHEDAFFPTVYCVLCSICHLIIQAKISIMLYKSG